MVVKCWIDNRRCYAERGSITLEHCKVCQRSRINRYAIKKEQPPTAE